MCLRIDTNLEHDIAARGTSAEIARLDLTIASLYVKRSDCCEQALSFWGVLEELDLGKTVPNLKGLGFSMLGKNDSMTFASNAWNITLDPETGMTKTCVVLAKGIAGDRAWPARSPSSSHNSESQLTHKRFTAWTA